MAREYQYKTPRITPARLKELRGFCEQYDEKQQRARETTDEAERARLLHDVALIDLALSQACNGERPMRDTLRENVVYRHGVTRLHLPPCGRATLYRKRTAFFNLLDSVHGRSSV